MYWLFLFQQEKILSAITENLHRIKEIQENRLLEYLNIK